MAERLQPLRHLDLRREKKIPLRHSLRRSTQGAHKMAKEVHPGFPFSASGLTLALILSGAVAHAQSDVQDLPNMGQQITPLAPLESRFQPLNPDLPYDPAFLAGQGWLAGQAVTTLVSPDHKTLLVLTSGYNRVSNTNVQPPASWYLPGSA